MELRVSRLAFCCLMSVVMSSAFVGSCQAQHQTGNSSIELPQFWDASAKPVSVPAPNGMLVLKVAGKRTGKSYPDDEWVPEYYIEMHGKRLQPSIKCFAMPHALWSSDSAWLAITSSDGGLVGNWKVFTYKAENDRVVTHNVMLAGRGATSLEGFQRGSILQEQASFRMRTAEILPRIRVGLTCAQSVGSLETNSL